MILVDTSGLLAALFPDQRSHRRCAAALAGAERRILSPFVLAETDYLISTLAGVEEEVAFLDDVARGAYELAAFDSWDVDRARAIVDRYRDLRPGLAEASLVVLAERHGVDEVLTLDERHFRVLPAAGGRPFTLLPADR